LHLNVIYICSINIKNTNMRLFLLSIITLITIGATYAQEFDQISVGSSYSDQTFYDLETGEKTTIDGDTWDIAFSVFGFQDAGVFINEAAPSMGVELELYDLGFEDFDVQVSQADVIDRLYNSDKSWMNGAFNEGRDMSDFTDFGWGFYNPATMSVDGLKLFAIKLRNGQFLKFKVEGLAGTKYTFRYANLDGSNEQSVTFDKLDYSGNHMAYFSFASEQMMDLEPAGWDLVYKRYSSPVVAGPDEILNYVVTGILTADGVKVAQADGIDPVTVVESDYSNDYTTDIDVIGFDWKDIDITTFQWSLILDRVYYVKTKDNNTYKLHFIDFEGSSTGVATFEKTEVMSTSTDEVLGQSVSIGNIFPNPTSGTFSLNYTSDLAGFMNLEIYGLDGRRMYSKEIQVQAGENNININDFNGAGTYFVKLDNGDKVFAQKLIIK